MAIIRLSLLLQVGFVIGSNYGYVEWSENDREIRGRQSVYNRQNSQPTHLRKQHSLRTATDQSALAQKTDDQLPRVVTAFLHTGDSSTLKHANCSRRYELSALRGRAHANPHNAMPSVLDTVMHATNFLNMLLQANRSREQSLKRDIEWYHALVRTILAGDSKIHRAVVTFNTESVGDGPHIFLQATRAGGEIILQDLSSNAHHILKNKTPETEWYHEHKNKKKPHFHKRVLSQDFASYDASVRNGESYVTDTTHIKWSAPYLECEAGNFIPRWLLTLSAGFYGLKPNLTPEFRGVVRVDVSLQDVDIDQCSTDGWFAGTHRCNLTSMECLPIPGYGFVLDKYRCLCRSGFYHPSRVDVHGYSRKAANVHDPEGLPYNDDAPSHCLPCQEGCAYCKNDTPCVARGDGYLRICLLSLQGIFMLLALISMVVVYHFRRNKSVRASGLVLLETILFGALLLYFPGMILYFQPSVFRCVLLRWVRMLGFATVYGTITLKLYRVLKVFLSRTAQRVPYMTSWKVLRLLGIILLIVLWFLVAWTSAVCQNPDRHQALISVGFTPDGLQFGLCLQDPWDYMMAVAEFLFLMWSVYLCYAVRTVPSAFHEPRFMSIAVHNELISSAVFHVVRFALAPELHPDWTLMLYFIHAHLTVTVTLGLMLIPKFLIAGTHLRDDIATEAYEDELDMGRSGSYLNSSITSAWSEHSLDPEDIREELKKLYSQLEIYKRKKMLANNPHLQKKRSSKKGLGRSLMRRITEIPETMARQHSREDREVGEHGGTRNSICALKKNPFDPTHSVKPAKEESLKSKVFSLKKSHSSYDHVRDQSEDSSSSTTDKMEVSTTDGSLLEALMGKKLVKKKSSDKIDATSESTESVPLVCKSASAHNLTADKKPPHPRTSVLQKSLSVIASAKEKTLGLTGRTQSVDDPNKKTQQKNKEAKTPVDNEEREGYMKMIVSQSAEYKQTSAKTGIMKHQVSGSQPSICSEPAKGKDVYDISEVCPWEVEDLPTPSENKIQKHVSIAPEETTTIHGGSGKAGKQQPSKLKGTDLSPSVSRRPHQKPTDRADICPWEGGSSESQGQMEAAKPTPSKQPGQPQTQAPGDNTKAVRAEVCPWDFEETPAKSRDSSEQSRLQLSSVEVKGKPGMTVAEMKGKVGVPVNRAKDVLSEPPKPSGSSPQPTSKEDVCPWDFESASSTYEKMPSSSQVFQTKETLAAQKGAATPLRTLQRETEKTKSIEDEKAKAESKDKPDPGKPKERALGQARLAEVCPWDVDSSPELGAVEKQKSPNVAIAKRKQADVCPWDFEDSAMTEEANRSTSFSTAKQKSPNSKQGGTKMSDVCPWDFDEQTLTKKA